MNAFVSICTLGATLLLAGTAARQTDFVREKPESVAAENNLSFVGKKWRPVSFVLETPVDLNGDGKLDHDLIRYLDDCAKDDAVSFLANGNVEKDNGLRHCGEDKPTLETTGTWTYQAGVLHVQNTKGDAGAQDWHLIQNDGKVLKARVEMTTDGVTLKATWTMKADQTPLRHETARN